MATSIGLDIGWRAIKLVQLEKKGKKIRLLKTGLHLISYKEKEGEAARFEEITKGLNQLLVELKISPNRFFNIALSGQSVFIRAIQVIAVSYDKLKQHIRFEAEQQIPFSLNEVLWDYCMVNPDKKKASQIQKSGSGQWKVILAAIKKSLVDHQLEFIQRIKGKCHLVDVGPVALHNSLCFTDPNLSKQTTVFVDMGARGTHLVVADKGEVWIRSFPLGSDRLTQVVAENLKISFAEAEVLKQRVGLVPTNDLVEKETAQAMNPGVAELLDEIGRSLEYYHTQVGGSTTRGADSKPSKIILGGGGAFLKGIIPIFEEKLGIPVQMWNGFEKLSVRSGKTESQAQFVTALGLALRGLVPCSIELNLLRDKVTKQLQRKSLQFYGGGAILLVLAILGTWVQTNRHSYEQKKAYLGELKKTLKIYQTYEPKIKELETKNETIQKRVKSLYKILQQRQVWLDGFDILQKLLPKAVWLTGYEGSVDIIPSSQDTTIGKISVTGRSLSYQGVTEFVTNLKNSIEFTHVKPVASNIKKLETLEEIVEFQLEMQIGGG